MSVFVNIRHLEEGGIRLKGEATSEAFELEPRDELIRVKDPVQYDLGVEKAGPGLLVQGSAAVELECRCVRCLEVFAHRVELRGWACHLNLSGDDAVPVANDLVDLTPFLREDIFLAFPQHPLCSPECHGLLKEYDGRAGEPPGGSPSNVSGSTWADLNKLEL